MKVTSIPLFTRLFFLLGAVLLLPFSVYAQYDNPHEYDTEWLYGITKATNSGLLGGFVVRYSQRIKEQQFKTYGFELVNIKHPKEVRYPNNNSTGNSIILRKFNYLYNLRAHYGRNLILFEKAQQKGVQINAIFAGGPSIGLVVPYYVGLSGGKQKKQKDLTAGDEFVGPGSLFKGVSETSFAPGVHAKAALSFEYGVTKKDLFGIEVGAMYEYFFKEVKIVNGVDNYNAYPNVYFSIFYGWRK